ncbi:MAG: GNAT family N-acetyltransferase [Halocynthiibacter sp.]
MTAAPDAAALYEVCEATWPPAATRDHAGWIIRDGAGGGKRVSAATAAASATLPDIAKAEAAMKSLDQRCLFQIRDGEKALDDALAARDYDIIDRVAIYLCPVAELTRISPPRLAAFQIFPPLQIMADLWAAGGIGAERLAIMARARGSKMALLARHNDRAAGVCFIGIHRDIAMLHALEVAPALRRQGVAVNIMRVAAQWAQNQGANWLSVIVTEQNTGANALYSSLGMKHVGHYHYRTEPQNHGRQGRI